MATPTDTTFGSDFNAAEFRQAITSTMEMGMATGTDDVATFYWEEINEFEYGSEEDTVPYDLGATPELVLQEANEVVVPVAVEFVSRATSASGTALGDFQEPRVILTLLDIHYELVSDADGVEFSGTKYSIDYTAPVMGLFDVNIYEIHASPIDEA